MIFPDEDYRNDLLPEPDDCEECGGPGPCLCTWDTDTDWMLVRDADIAEAAPKTVGSGNG